MNTGVITNSIRCDRGKDIVEEEVLDRDVTHTSSKQSSSSSK